MSPPGGRPSGAPPADGAPLLGVVFDFDGVIADTEPLHLQAFRDTLREREILLSREEYEARYLGFDDEGVFRALAEDPGFPRARHPDEIERLIGEMTEEKEKRFDALVAENDVSDVVYPDAPACIERLTADGLMLGIASGALHKEIEGILNRAGLRQHFSTIVAADDVERQKPAPDSYTRAVERLCAALGRPPSPAGFVTIEDSRWGIEAAVAAGLPCLGVTTTYDADALSGATAIVSGLAEVDRPLLARLCRRSAPKPVDVRAQPVQNGAT